MRLAKQVGLDRDGLIIEGKRFPFFIAAEAVEVQTDESMCVSTIRIGILAESVHLDPALTVETDGDVQLVSESELTS